MKVLNSWLIVMLILVVCSCKKNKANLNNPPLINFKQVRVIDSLSMPIDTVYANNTTVYVNYGARVELDCEIESEGEFSQLDIIVYGLAKDDNNILLDTAYIVNSFGKKSNLIGMPSIDWPNTSFREGFLTNKYDRFKIILSKITDKSDVVILVSDKFGLSSNKSFPIEKY